MLIFRNLNFDKNNHIADVVLDISKLQNELELKLKQNLDYEYIIDELSKENHNLKQINLEMNEKKEKILQSLENGINELEEAKEKLKSLEIDKFSLNKELNEIKEYNNKILIDYNIILEKYNTIEKNLKEKDLILDNYNKILEGI